MLSVAKLRVGQEAYQLSGVAQSLDDYYTGAGEAPGRWVGEGSQRLGLDGDVAAADLRAVLAGLMPGSGGLSPNGEQLRVHPRRVPGFDLTFKVPKSVSVLYAVSDDPRVQGAIVEAGDRAVRETISWLEREVIRVRRGNGNQQFLADLALRDPQAAEAAAIRVLPASGVVAATFRHRTSRAGDPLLHWHTLIANLAEGPDGRWSAFVHPELYRSARTVGEVFQTVLRAELTARLGLSWRPGRHVPEVAGVPQLLCDAFSKRSKDIEAWLDASGATHDPAGRQRAVLATRRHKPEVEGERFDLVWKAEAIAHGWGPEEAERLLREGRPVPAPLVGEAWRDPTPRGGEGAGDRLVGAEEWVRDALRELTQEDSTFARRDLVRVVASRLGDGATVPTLERVVAQVLASPELVPVAATGGGSGSGSGRWTSRELLAVEAGFVALVASRDPRPRVPDELVEVGLRSRPTIGADQAAAVRVLSGMDVPVAALVGPAGTGKTYTLATVRAIYESAGFRVVGAAPSARAALELEASGGIPAATLQRRSGEWSRGFDMPGAETVLVIDEAGMAASRDLEPLMAATVGAGGRVILVGDHHQLPEVTAGGGFAHAVDHAKALAVLQVNRRQHEPWERVALSELRERRVASAVAAYRDHDRVVVADDRSGMLDLAVAHWFAARANGQDAVLLAGTNEMVDALNQCVRRELLDRGLLDGEPVGEWAGRAFVIGDRVVLRSNSYRERTPEGIETAVLNGQPGTVVSGTDASLVVRLDRDARSVELTTSYLRHGWVDHGYALTSHRAQGGTWDLAIAVGTDGLYREGAYVQLSRGRHSNWLVITRRQLDTVDAELDRHDHGIPLPAETPPDLDEELIAKLSKSRAKLMALARDPHAGTVEHMARTRDLTSLEAVALRSRNVEQRVAHCLEIDPAALNAAAVRTRHTAAHLAVGQLVKAHDRHNVGTVDTIDDTAGRATVIFTSPSGRTVTRNLSWEQLEIVSPRDPDPRAPSPVIDATVDRLLEPIATPLVRWRDRLADHGVHPLDAEHAERAARHLVDAAAARLVARDPDWLHHVIGERPSLALPARVWDDAVADLATFRARHHIRDDDIAPGTAASPPAGQDELSEQWAALAARLDATRQWIQNYESTPTLRTVRARATGELETRRHELEALFETAPPDQRHLLDTLCTDGQLPLDDSATVLSRALEQHGNRRAWIVANWPHIVEYAEVNRVLDERAAGPDTALLAGALTQSSGTALATAAAKNEAWLHSLLSQLVAPGMEVPAPDVCDLLDRVAAYRQNWHVEHHTPLGVSASTPEQQHQRDVLAAELSGLPIAVPGGARDEVALRGCDDAQGLQLF